MIPERVAFAASILFLFVAPFASSGGTRAACLIVATLAIALGGTWREALEHRPPRAVVVALALWFVLAPLSLAWTIDWHYTLAELRAETFYTLLAFVVFFALASDSKRWRIWCIALFAGTLTAFGAKVLQQELGIPLWRWHSPDGGPGAFSTHLVLVAPLFVAIVWESPWGFRKGAAVVAAALLALVAAAWATREPWTTPNRIVWLAFAVAFVVAIAATRVARGFEHASRPGLRAVILVGSAALALAFTASIVAKNERFYRNDPSLTASLDQDLRPRLWALGFQEWKQAPMLGYGLGREILADAFLPETPPGEHPPVRHGHNVFLNVALQLGALGLAAFAMVLVVLMRQYASLLTRADTSALGVIGLALLAGFVTKNLTDDFLHRHNAQIFWALNGMLLGFSARARAA